MSKASVEDIKLASVGLRGQLGELFADTSTPNIPEDSNILLKHHGSYQQDDRDVRAERTKAKLEKAWSFMIRSKMPGGRISAPSGSSMMIFARRPWETCDSPTARASSSTVCSKAA
jgi:sulfite reductase beta subunit-like hemoprotein